MSGIGCIFNLDESPVDKITLHKMSQAMLRRGPDGMGTCASGPVGLVHRHFWTTPEDVSEQQPLSFADRQYSITADARLDNRDDLIAQLYGYSSRETVSDAQLIAAAYAKWDDQCVNKLVGDFAFIIWDQLKHRLFLARDPIGVRVLHYTLTSSRFIAATDISAILAVLGETPPLNHDVLRDLISLDYNRCILETVYRSIYRVPPAHFFVVSRNGIQKSRYWLPASGCRFHWKTDRECVESFGDVLGQAVRSRLRSRGAVGIFAGGGLDSSAIACLVSRECKTLSKEDTFSLFGLRFQSTPGADESEYFDELAKWCDSMRVFRIPSDHCWTFCDAGSLPEQFGSEPEFDPVRPLLSNAFQFMNQNGCSTILTGHGGDQVFAGNPYLNPQFIIDLPWTRLVKEIKHFSRIGKRPYWWLLYLRFLRPHIPARLIRVFASFVRKKKSFVNSGSSSSDKRSTLEDFSRTPQYNSYSLEKIYGYITRGMTAIDFIMLDHCGVETGTEIRMPFYDRRLVDFLFSLSPHLLFRDGRTKWLLRTAMNNLMPEMIRNRTGKAHFAGLVIRGLGEREKGLIDSLFTGCGDIDLGLTDATSVKEVWASFKVNACMENAWKIFLTASVQKWLRSKTTTRK